MPAGTSLPPARICGTPAFGAVFEAFRWLKRQWAPPFF